MDPPYRIALAS
uniref:Uncharacterized protein n=1 Tax=Arundo donax TaxID=35708 RepID=A0A0A9A243_ARUDO